MTKKEAYEKAIHQTVIETKRGFDNMGKPGWGCEFGWIGANIIRQRIEENGGYEGLVIRQSSDLFFEYDGKLVMKLLRAECKKIGYAVRIVGKGGGSFTYINPLVE